MDLMHLTDVSTIDIYTTNINSNLIKIVQTPNYDFKNIAKYI